MANQHIDQIAEECGIDHLPGQDTLTVSREDLEHFAKAIIQNCLDVLGDTGQELLRADNELGYRATEECHYKIKKHFRL